MTTKPFSTQLRPLVFTLFYCYLPAIFLLSCTVMMSYIKQIPVSVFLRDVTAVAGVPFYTGAVSNIGIMLWCSTTTICFLSAVVLHRINKHAKSTNFFFYSGMFTLILMLDDAFLLHEYGYHAFLGFPMQAAFVIYALFTVLFFCYFIKFILHSNYVLLVLSIVLLSFSVLFDQLSDAGLAYLLHATDETLLFIEDSCKFLGITSWFSYFFWTGYETLILNLGKVESHLKIEHSLFGSLSR